MRGLDIMTKIAMETFSFKANFFVVWSEVVKAIKFLTAYPVIFVFWAVFPIFWFVPFVLQGQAFVGGLQSPSFARITGTPDFIPFVIVGAILNSYVLTSLYGMGESLKREAYQGTLDYLFSSPCNKAFILIGKALSESVSSTIYGVIQLIVSIFFFGIEITLEIVMPIIGIIILLILGLYGIALGLAAASLQFKHGHDIARSLEYVFYLFSPVRYPVQSLPFWAQVISRFLPLTYALIAMRSLVLLKQDPSAFSLEIFLLLAIDIAAIIIGFYFFNWMEKKTRRSGAISHF